MKLRQLWNSIWPPLVAVILFLILWQAATSLFHIEKWILPSPADIAKEASTGAAGLWRHTLATLRLLLLGFAIGTAVGLLMAFALHVVPFLKSSLYPLIILSQNVPTIALAPLLMIWFGFGILPKIIVITLVCFFPVAVAAMDGLSRADRVMLDYMRMAGASKGQIFTKLEIPHALPSILSGIKIAATYSVMGAVIAEWIGADKGIGYYMMLQKSSFRTDKIFLAIAIIVAISLAMFGLIALLEKWLIRYKPAKDDK
ncbi:ABC-type nitrate/sulfonate/bicarbonate transport system permease component [Fontibacillus phaseoli]|uniref:ABC-type nitrate/sulfonate/bicarbonate transport system permease component n=1 Tax=Fontibacillus phaseoli TaxID=1416533 RepID=A0A369B998_9BACL|nr:ABC transporter permease [Fontibacillus phaseoli]RCX18102.1 ABC-type nitrate/sulfonate/bicarbonate transport system permease component [Fontibacillus phaseoli]